MRKFKLDPFFTLSLVTFFCSLFFTAYTTESEAAPAFMCLLVGWGGVIGNCFAWFANPLLFLAWGFLLIKVRIIAVITGFLTISALILMLSFLLTTSIIRDEAGHMTPILHRGIGYWLWLSSGLLAAIAAIRQALLTPKPTDSLNNA